MKNLLMCILCVSSLSFSGIRDGMDNPIEATIKKISETIQYKDIFGNFDVQSYLESLNKNRDTTTAVGITLEYLQRVIKDIGRGPIFTYDRSISPFKVLGTSIPLLQFSDNQLSWKPRNHAIPMLGDTPILSFEPLPTQRKQPFLKEHSRGVTQREAGQVHSQSERYIIGSVGADPGVIVIMYNEHTQVAAAAHIDAVTDSNHAIGLLETKANALGEHDLKVYLATSQLDQNKTLEKIKKRLSKEWSRSKLEEVYCSSSLALNTRTGEIYTNFYNSLEWGKNLDQRLKIVDITARLHLMFIPKVNFVFSTVEELDNYL